MTSKADMTKRWKDFTPEERREALNTLGAIEEKDDEQQREHDVLATMVAKDEES